MATSEPVIERAWDPPPPSLREFEANGRRLIQVHRAIGSERVRSLPLATHEWVYFVLYQIALVGHAGARREQHEQQTDQTGSTS